MYSSLLAVTLLVLCGQPFFLWTVQSACRNKVADYVRPARPLFYAACYRFQYKLKVITPSRLKSDLATLDYSQFFMVSSFSESITLVISPLATTMARWWQWHRQHSCWSAKLVFYCKVLVQQHIKSSHVWNSRIYYVNNPLVLTKISKKQFLCLK